MHLTFEDNVKPMLF